MTLGIEKKGGQFAVVDYGQAVTQYSKLLTIKEQKSLDKTGKLPAGVTVKQGFKVVELFNTKQQAQKFIKTGRIAKPKQLGIFKSAEQAKKIKQLVKS